jgi:hypothetical protein
MPRAGFEPAISMFERPKTVLALDRAAIETGPIQNKRQNYGSVYFILQVFRDEKERYKTLNRTVTSIPRI